MRCSLTDPEIGACLQTIGEPNLRTLPSVACSDQAMHRGRGRAGSGPLALQLPCRQSAPNAPALQLTTSTRRQPRIWFGHRPTPVNTAVPLPFRSDTPKLPFGPITPSWPATLPVPVTSWFETTKSLGFGGPMVALVPDCPRPSPLLTVEAAVHRNGLDLPADSHQSVSVPIHLPRTAG